MQLCWEEIELKAALQGRDKWSDLAKLAYARNIGNKALGMTEGWPGYENDIKVTNRFTRMLAEMVRLMRADNFRRLKTLDFCFCLKLSKNGEFDQAGISHMYCDTATHALTVDSNEYQFWLRPNNELKYYWQRNSKDKSKLPYEVNLKTHYDDCLELFRKYFVSKGVK